MITAKKIIRVGLLFIIVILGLMVVFPETPDLIDLMISENNTQKDEPSIIHYSDRPKKKSWGFGKLFSKNIAPSRDQIQDYLLQVRYVQKVECIGDIPKITYDKESHKVSPPSSSISFQVIYQTMNTPQLKSGKVALKASLHSKSYGHLLSWLDSNRFEEWNYKTSMNHGGELFSQTKFSALMRKVRIKKCDF